MTLSAAASSGDRLKALQVLRDELAGRMEACTSDQNYAVMGRLLADTLGQIAVVEKNASGQKPESPLGQLSLVRGAAGLPNAAGKSRAAR